MEYSIIPIFFPDWLIELTVVIGTLVLLCIICFSLIGLSKAIKDLIGRIKYSHERAHRFNRPPVARCYCKDCEEWHQNETDETEGMCWGFAKKVTADNWFCWNAVPRKRG